MLRVAKVSKKDLLIKGKNLILRWVNGSDINDKYLRWMQNTEVNQFLESRFEKWNMRKLVGYFEKNKDNPDYIFLAIILKDNLEHIGNIKVGPINWIHKFADIGIIIGEKGYWGRGLATEAIRLTVDYCFKKLKLQKLTAGTYRDNIGSVKIFKNCGFKIEGIRRKQYHYKGRYVDAILLGIVKR